jgi:hypothetical protein
VTLCAGLTDTVRAKLSVAEKQRQNYIQELITTEETYNTDMAFVLEVSNGWSSDDLKLFSGRHKQEILMLTHPRRVCW